MKLTKKLSIPLTLLAIATMLGLLSGCGTAAHRVDEQSNEGLTTVRNLDFKDYQIAAEDLINKLLAHRVFENVDPNKKPIIMVSRIKNSTSSHLDTQLLTQKITIALDKSNKAQTSTHVYKEGTFDPGTKRARELSEEEGFDPDTLEKQNTLQAPRYSLSGEITELYREQGRKRESYYQIYMTLTDVRTGVAVWQDAKEVVKQDKKPLISL